MFLDGLLFGYFVSDGADLLEDGLTSIDNADGILCSFLLGDGERAERAFTLFSTRGASLERDAAAAKGTARFGEGLLRRRSGEEERLSERFFFLADCLPLSFDRLGLGLSLRSCLALISKLIDRLFDLDGDRLLSRDLPRE